MEYRKLTELAKLPNNPRTIKDDSFKSLCKSIQDNPDYFEARPVILSDRTGELVIIAGNQRYEAAKHLKLSTIPTHLLTGLTEEREREIIIRDNVANGEWDMDLLADWDKVKLEEWGVDVVWPVIEPEATEDDFEIPDTIETDIVLGDLFEIGEHRLLCGDSTISDNYIKLMLSQSFDMIVTDPPYNVDYTGKTKDALKIENDNKSNDDFKKFIYDHFVSIGLSSKSGAVYYIFQPDKQIHIFIGSFIEAGNKYSGLLIWKKDSMVMSRGDYNSKHETITYGWKDGSAHRWQSDSKQVSILEFDRPKRSEEHPTMKPIALLSYLIKNNSKVGDLIGDGFLGSGSTMVASHQLNRKCYGMELDPKYCQVIIDRMKKLDPSIIIKRNGGVI